jgi:hypothetical protein
MGEKWPIKFSLKIMTSTEIVRDFLHATELRHRTDDFASPPKEGMLRINKHINKLIIALIF